MKMKKIVGRKAEVIHRENIEKMEKAYGVKIEKVNNVPKIQKNKAEYYQKPVDKEMLTENDMNELLAMEEEMDKELTEEIKAKLTGRKQMNFDELLYNDFQEWIDCLKENIDKDVIISNNPMGRTLGFNYIEKDTAHQRSITINEVKQYIFNNKEKSKIDEKICSVIKMPSDEKAIDKVKKIIEIVKEAD